MPSAGDCAFCLCGSPRIQAGGIWDRHLLGLPVVVHACSLAWRSTTSTVVYPSLGIPHPTWCRGCHRSSLGESVDGCVSSLKVQQLGDLYRPCAAGQSSAHSVPWSAMERSFCPRIASCSVGVEPPLLSMLPAEPDGLLFCPSDRWWQWRLRPWHPADCPDHHFRNHQQHHHHPDHKGNGAGTR